MAVLKAPAGSRGRGPEGLTRAWSELRHQCVFAHCSGRLYPSLKLYPSAADGTGFKHLSNAVHAMGLKFGWSVEARNALLRMGLLRGRRPPTADTGGGGGLLHMQQPQRSSHGPGRPGGG